jgi:hypothetical protein
VFQRSGLVTKLIHNRKYPKIKGNRQVFLTKTEKNRRNQRTENQNVQRGPRERTLSTIYKEITESPLNKKKKRRVKKRNRLNL